MRPSPAGDRHQPFRAAAALRSVHLLLEPAERGGGIQLSTACPTDVLDLNWQRLISRIWRKNAWAC
ncbi:MAG: hypothetical protein ACLUDF_04640 [Butyricicoccus sp.]